MRKHASGVLEKTGTPEECVPVLAPDGSEPLG